MMVLPNYLSDGRGAPSGVAINRSDSVIRVGRVKAVRSSEISDIPVYDVEVQYRDGLGNSNVLMYYGVVRADLFGGIADSFQYSLRLSPNTKEERESLGVGSLVVLACINGHRDSAIIIGGYPHPNREPIPKDEHVLRFVFNGVEVFISSAGEVTLTRNGPTNAQGEAQGEDGDLPGATLRLASNGSLTAFSGGDEPQSVTIDPEKSKVTIDAAKGDVEILSDGGSVKIETSGSVDFDVSKLSVNGGGQSLIRGSAYRQAESQMFSQFAAVLTEVSAALSAAGAALVSSGVAAAAGPPVTQAGAALARAAVAVNTFEGKAATFLSKSSEID